jgi:choline-sulfatase
VSLCDDLIGSVLGVLAETGLDKNTGVVFTSDHGDMLGERGLWYKKSFFEGSCRVPLMVSCPERFEPGRRATNVSLVDLLPTFTDLAWNGTPPEAIDPLDGMSLVPLLDGQPDKDEGTVYGENLAEGTVSPIVMVKRGSTKYVTGGTDPDQLFDLRTDPDERTNLADSDAHQNIKAELATLASDKWDLGLLDRDIRTSLRRRLFLRGLGPADWNYTPPNLANDRVLRDGAGFNEWLYGSELRPRP